MNDQIKTTERLFVILKYLTSQVADTAVYLSGGPFSATQKELIIDKANVAISALNELLSTHRDLLHIHPEEDNTMASQKGVPMPSKAKEQKGIPKPEKTKAQKGLIMPGKGK